MRALLHVAAGIALLLMSAMPAAAQSGLFAGGSAGVEGGIRGNLEIGRIPAAGALVGWRFNDSWSAEVHIDSAFGETAPRRFETLLFSGMTLRSEVYGLTVRQERAGVGYAVLAAWTSAASGRVRATVTMGIAERRFEIREITTVSRIGPDVNLPPGHPLLQDRDETSTLLSRGLTGGFLAPIAVGGGWTVAPEIRFTSGLWKGHISSFATVRARVMWGF